MKTLNFASTTVFAFSLLGLIISSNASAQQLGIKRTDLQHYDLSVPGYETVQARIDFEAHSAFGKHSHPGEELIYVLEGLLEYEVEGQAPITLKAGEVLFIPAGVVHAARNSSHAKASELATYIVEKGKPVLVMKKE